MTINQIDLSLPEEVGPALLTQLASRLDVSDLRFAQAPEQISHGWETYIYTFRLAGDALSPPWRAPLILRIYPGADQGLRAELEASVQRFARERGYPAPLPLAVDAGEGALGRPFMVMEQAAGLPMLDRIAGRPTSVFRLAGVMAGLHAELHHLSVEGCPLPSEGTLVERRLLEFRRIMDELKLELPADAQKALQWLEDHKAMVIPEEVSLCHHDFHPLNLMVDEGGGVVVIDWSGAALGDRHSDIASTLVLLRTAPAAPEGLIAGLMARFGRGIFAWLYLRRYRSQLPLDPERLRYWEALRAFEWWAMLAALDLPDSAAAGVKPDTPERVPEGHRERMHDYFWERAL